MEKGNRGFLKLLIVIVIALIVLSYFGFDLRSVIEAPRTQENLRYFWSLMQDLWFSYIVGGVMYIWNNVVIDVLWKNLVIIWDMARSK